MLVIHRHVGKIPIHISSKRHQGHLGRSEAWGTACSPMVMALSGRCRTVLSSFSVSLSKVILRFLCVLLDVRAFYIVKMQPSEDPRKLAKGPEKELGWIVTLTFNGYLICPTGY